MADDENPDDRSHISPVSDEVILARTRLNMMITFILGIPVACLGVGLLAIMAVPLAHVIAGKHTDFTLTMSASFNAVLTVSTAVTGTGLAIQSKNARHHRNRARELEKKIKRQDEDPGPGRLASGTN